MDLLHTYAPELSRGIATGIILAASTQSTPDCTCAPVVHCHSEPDSGYSGISFYIFCFVGGVIAGSYIALRLSSKFGGERASSDSSQPIVIQSAAEKALYRRLKSSDP